MGLDTAPARSAPSRTVSGGRGRPLTVTLRRTTAIAPLIEAQSLCAEVINSADRIYTAATVGSVQAVLNEAGRLGVRAQEYRAEFHRLAGELEK